MSSGLARWGVEAPTVVRAPTTDSGGVVICPEDGKPVEGSRGTQRIAKPAVVGSGPDLGDETLTHGYRCDRHTEPVVLPEDPESLPDGWIAVEMELADERTRLVPVPAAEVDHGE